LCGVLKVRDDSTRFAVVRFVLPYVLLVLAAAIAAVGASRLRTAPKDPERGMRQAFIVWLFLLVTSISVWLLASS
jgi:hypothetical protein